MQSFSATYKVFHLLKLFEKILKPYRHSSVKLFEKYVLALFNLISLPKHALHSKLVTLVYSIIYNYK